MDSRGVSVPPTKGENLKHASSPPSHIPNTDLAGHGVGAVESEPNEPEGEIGGPEHCALASDGNQVVDNGTLPLPDLFTAHDTTSVECSTTLPGPSHPSTNPPLDNCTCGSCISGFMSPRMKITLLITAKHLYTALNSGVITGDHWLGYNEAYNKYAPETFRKTFIADRLLREGYTNLFEHIAICLQKNRIPSQDTLWGVLRRNYDLPALARYWLLGGQVTDALQVVFDFAEGKDSVCGEGASTYVVADNMVQLPECRNDCEFRFVAERCGISEKARAASL